MRIAVLSLITLLSGCTGLVVDAAEGEARVRLRRLDGCPRAIPPGPERIRAATQTVHWRADWCVKLVGTFPGGGGSS